MAFLKTSDFEKEIEAFKRAGGDSEKLIKKMLGAGVKVAVAAWKDVITKRGHVDTGDMRDSVKKAWVSPRNGAAKIEPIGYGRKHTPHMLKAFVIHYGRGNLKGDLFVDEVENRISDEGFEKMYETYIEFLKQEGL